MRAPARISLSCPTKAMKSRSYQGSSSAALLLFAWLLPGTAAWQYPARSSLYNPVVPTIRGLATNSTIAQNNTNAQESSPTSSPTESPAPSPSPSYQPTSSPTHTNKPTERPTASPTESPAPSPSPSFYPTLNPTVSPQPSVQPTTTRFPTEMPSNKPSSFPTISARPSSKPSHGPSMLPSASPTISLIPSASPTLSPSVSSAPSNFPTFVGTQSAVFTAFLNLTEKLTAEEQLAFVAGTEDFVEQVSVKGELNFPQVVLEEQTQVPRGIDVTPNASRRASNQRSVEQVSSTPQNIILQLRFEVTAIYSGADTEFDLFAALNPLFLEPDKLWIHMLGNYNDVFLSLRPSDTSAVKTETNDSNTTITKGGLSVILIVALCSVGIAIGAAIYSVKSHSLSEYGEALESPRGLSVDSFDGDAGLNPFQDTGAVGPALVKTRAGSYNGSHENDTKEENRVYEEDVAICGFLQPVRPDHAQNDLESVTMKSEMEGSENIQLKQLPLQRTHGSVDPPTESEVGFSEANYEQYGYQLDTTTSRDRPARLLRKVLGARPGNDSDLVLAEQRVQFYTGDQELMLTKSMGGTLGATAVAAASPISSRCSSSQAESFFDNILSSKKKKSKSGNLQQGMAGYSVAQLQQQFEQINYESALRKGGLYDVFAPAGPIGIVVDTTKEGPCVHSLKPTSPMLGLITPGDLIVGLDDEDTRQMTAATLTRLMARKSNQKERKITLLAASGY